MTSTTKAVSLDFGVPYVTGIVTIEQEESQEPAVAPGEAPAQQEEPDTRAQDWYITEEDTAAAMWDFR